MPDTDTIGLELKSQKSRCFKFQGRSRSSIMVLF